MKGGCFRNVFALIGCLTVLVLAAIGAWAYRGQLLGVYRSVVGAGGATASGSGAEATVGFPSTAALRSAERKEASIARRRGPGYVRLTADEVASLIEHRLEPEVRRALDSLRVTLTEDRFALEGQILLDVFSLELLGPLVELLGSRQPMRAAGPVALEDPGTVAWRCDEFIIQSFPFPPSAIPRLVNRLTGGSEGAFLIPVPATVGDVRVRADGVTFYRRAD